MKAKITLLPGDGIGPEIISATTKILERIGDKFGHEFEMQSNHIGGIAIDETGGALPDITLESCKKADAVLLGAVGGPKWDDPNASVRPEQGLLGLRKELGLFANLRPVQPHPELMGASPLKESYLEGVDMLILRELTGGVYFGEPREKRINANGEEEALDTMIYSESEVRRIAKLAFDIAGTRRKKVTSVDKANVLESSRLWRKTVAKLAVDYPEIELENLLVDAATMHLLSRPRDFDVMVTMNLFGDIITDESSMLTGSMGNMPSAALGEDLNSFGKPRGMYEPIHGSAPDIAGKGIANPIGTILSAAMMLRHSLGLNSEAEAIEKAVDAVLNAGHRTADIIKEGESPLGTKEMTKKIIQELA
ncbi:MAG: 3-isopropylmalate dehydrogenase [Anaerolineae bacterium]|jgi:3-isopropylmalate dehydrogenase|nr:3-isopropylmalate dehydrogenase [Anaerolineae bacterium]MBT4312399.1 3-isopropylmalate dehydrogenase [Anaerolineae bacterium]MBT4459357.1 3-isopropylmalate dehydrogenase [Anaerolineae bacterium]MBT4841040.1 3-isopropylmalate dehydrogenase [Anaerolineae bacterium]MBT6062281.1 3-isopropylmalate dehydrogenase [Anaerolineae bacterium]